MPISKEKEPSGIPKKGTLCTRKDLLKDPVDTALRVGASRFVQELQEANARAVRRLWYTGDPATPEQQRERNEIMRILFEHPEPFST